MKNNIRTVTQLIILSGILITSCNKVTTHEDVKSPETKGSTKEYYYNQEDIVCLDGTLHFKTSEAFLGTIDHLANETNIEAFDKMYNFYSLASYITEVTRTLIGIENENERIQRATRNYPELVEYLGEGVVVPKIMGRGYTLVANPEGVYYVEGVKYTITPENLIAEYPTSEKNPNGKVEVLDYIVPFKKTGTRATEGQFYDVRYEGSDRKVFCRVSNVKYASPGCPEALYIESHISGQKKNIFGWNSYSSNFKVYWDITMSSGNGSGIFLLDYQFQLEDKSGSGCLAWYPRAKVTRYFEHSNHVQFDDRMRIHASSQGTYPCGAIINHNLNSETPYTSCGWPAIGSF